MSSTFLGRNKYIVLFAATSSDSFKSFSILKSLDGIDTQHGCTQLRMQFIEFRFTQTNWTTLDNTCNNSSNGITFRFYLGDEIFHLFSFFLIRATYDIVFDSCKIILPVVSVKGDIANLRCVCGDADAELTQCQFSKSSSYASGDGDTGRRTASATMVAYAILLMIGIVCMRRTEQTTHIFVVL